MNPPDAKIAPRNETSTPLKPGRRLVIGAAVAAVVLALLVMFLAVPGVNQAVRFQSPPGEETDGYNITNNSGTMLFFQSVGGHVGAPLQKGQAWLPGQTLNFEVDSGTWAWEWFTADAYFEAYYVGGPNNGIDAGTVDVHFNTGPGNTLSNPAMAYLNPTDTAPLIANAVGFTPRNVDGETWTMVSNGDNRIVSSASVSYGVDEGWSFQGVTADQLRTSVTTAKEGTCTSPTSTLTNCTLGNTSWSFDWT